MVSPTIAPASSSAPAISLHATPGAGLCAATRIETASSHPAAA
nr:hypothetical protein [Novosphingobium sp. 9]